MSTSLIVDLVILLAIVLAWLNRNYLGPFAKAKAQNLATKQDISEITERVEDVRSKYLAELEGLKAHLEVTTSKRSAFAENRREALISFFDDSLILIENLNKNHGDIAIDEIAEVLVEYQDNVLELFTKVFRNYQRLLLYFGSDSELVGEAERFAQSARKARRAFRSNFGSVKITLVEEAKAQKAGDEGSWRQAVEETNQANKKFRNAIDPHVKEMTRAFQNYLVALNKHLRSEGRQRMINPFGDSNDAS